MCIAIYPGQYYDAETGLHFNWNRYYDPEIGRYIRTDPIGLNGGMNIYAYVGGNPTNITDPTGLYYGDNYCTEGACLPGPSKRNHMLLTGGFIGVGISIISTNPPAGPVNPPASPTTPANPPASPATPAEGGGKVLPFPGTKPIPDTCEEDDDDEHCMKLYERCVAEGWKGDCGTCRGFCRTQGYWDFLNCPAQKR